MPATRGNALKKILGTPVVMAILTLIILAGLQYVRRARDERIRASLSGVWAFDNLGSFTFHPDGTFASQITNSTAHCYVTQKGNFRIRNGFFFDTITHSSRTNAHLPYSSHSRILSASGREIIIIDGDAGNIEHFLQKKSDSL